MPGDAQRRTTSAGRLIEFLYPTGSPLLTRPPSGHATTPTPGSAGRAPGPNAQLLASPNPPRLATPCLPFRCDSLRLMLRPVRLRPPYEACRRGRLSHQRVWPERLVRQLSLIHISEP